MSSQSLMQTRVVMVRRLQILKGNMGAQIVNIVAFMIQPPVVGTVFLRIPNTTETFSRGGVLYLSVLSLVSTRCLLTFLPYQCYSARCSELLGRNTHPVRSPPPDPTSSKGSHVPSFHRSCRHDSRRYPHYFRNPSRAFHRFVLYCRSSIKY